MSDTTNITPNDPAAVEVSEQETIDVTWRDFVICVPASFDDWDGDALEALENGKAMTALRGVLGSANRDALVKDFATKYDRKMLTRDWGDLLETIVKDGYGVQLGE